MDIENENDSNSDDLEQLKECTSVDDDLVIAERFSSCDESIETKKRKLRKDPFETKIDIRQKASDAAARTTPLHESSSDPVAAGWLKPFEHGWRRELVYRSMSNDGVTKAPTADVYYFTPDGTKMRSMPQIANYLEKHETHGLTATCFTFAKRVVFHEPEESVRHAGSNRGGHPVSKSTSQNASIAELCEQASQSPSAVECGMDESSQSNPVRIVVSETKMFALDSSVISARHVDEIGNRENGDDLLTTSSQSDEGLCLSYKNRFASSDDTPVSTCEMHSSQSLGHNLTTSEANLYSRESADSKSSSVESAEDNANTLCSFAKEETTSSSLDLSQASVVGDTAELPSGIKSPCNTTSVQLESMTAIETAKSGADVSSGQSEVTTSGVESHSLVDEIIPKSTGNAVGSCVDQSNMDSVDDCALNLKVNTNGIQHHSECKKSSEGDNSDVVSGFISNDKSSVEHKSCVKANGEISRVVGDSSSALEFQNALPEQNQNWIGAQILALPRDVANSLNLSRPITVRFNSRSIIVPSSCISLTAEGAKVLLPPNTLSPSSVSQLSEAMDFSARLLENVVNGSLKSDRFSVDETKLVADVNSSAHHVSPADFVSTGLDLSHSRIESENLAVKEGPASKDSREITGTGVEILDSNLDCMLHVLSYLGIMDLVRVSEVSDRWRDISRDKLLWKTVKLNGIRVTNWTKAIAAFSRGCTRHLDLCGVLHQGPPFDSWNAFKKAVDQLLTVTRLTFHDVTPSALYAAVDKMPQLESLCASAIFDISADPEVKEVDVRLDVGKFARLKNLRTLRLHGEDTRLCLPSFSFNADILNLGELRHLQDLQIATLAAHGECFHFLGRLTQLEHLDIGDCLAWSKETYGALAKLVNLRSLRLRYGGTEDDEGLSHALSCMTRLQSLELTRFNISTELACTLAELKHLETFIIHPSMDHEPWRWQNNSRMFVAVCHMDFLKRLDWIVEGMDKTVGILFGLPSLGGKVLSCRDELKTLVPGHDVEFHDLDHFQTYLRSILRFGTVVNVYASRNQER